MNDDLNDCIISDNVLNYFNNYEMIKNDDLKNRLDAFIRILAFIYDINYEKSLEIIKEENYINKMTDNFIKSIGNERLLNDIELVRKRIIEYLSIK